jgi:hypothetical protein
MFVVSIIRYITSIYSTNFKIDTFLASGRGAITKVKPGISGKMFILNIDKFLSLNSILLLANVLS